MLLMIDWSLTDLVILGLQAEAEFPSIPQELLLSKCVRSVVFADFQNLVLTALFVSLQTFTTSLFPGSVVSISDVQTPSTHFCSFEHTLSHSPQLFIFMSASISSPLHKSFPDSTSLHA